MQTDLIQEARRQAEICNACRYCEGYCSVFPSLHANRAFSDGDITQLANLCHNCRGCYYACQYTAPHEFDLNLPAALAEVRHDSWEELAYPSVVARQFQKNGMAVAIAATLCFAVLFALAKWIGLREGEGFYAVMSHNLMVAIFAPAFLFPLASLVVSLRRYWSTVDGKPVTFNHIKQAFGAVANMRNLAGGHGDGCNFEDEDRFTQARRTAHQLVLYGFLLCFASTSSGTILHYVFDLPAPYGLFSLPKLLGIPGGLMMTFGAIWLFHLKLKADPELGAKAARSGEFGFIALLGFVGFSGLALYGLGATTLMPVILALHLGSVLAFFLLTPYTKMAHGFYRLAALVRDAQRKGA
ncbi:tricarballylate utilization 4Fe-4S protein TcuB [Phaeobacter sp. J2-8]|uniref:tricarballylate utilization 4Fe-4S protein TcuB n=1 Tax=Phaeobacter sp. J2-8 TaxID=2931394 RepID=UPI001FD52635|nr:tricarballylate utilization 4Fe-4S protein TcuB [Phaeobacter sp. J2-8]MCJ7873419.1 tricarballylate utilization 4Fe-4S protein TcuB [Phaeobacter sp. J2-8]